MIFTFHLDGTSWSLTSFPVTDMNSTKAIIVSKYVENKTYKNNWQQGYYNPKKISPDENRSTFYQVLKPFMFCQRIIGGFPYTVHKGKYMQDMLYDTVQLKVFSLLRLYSAIFFGLQIGMLFMANQSDHNPQTNSFDRMFYDMMLMIMAVSEITNLVILWFKTPYIARYFRKWKSFENDLGGQNIVLKMNLMRKWTKLMSSLVIVYMLISAYVQVNDGINLYIIPLAVTAKANTYLYCALFIFSSFFAISISSDLIKRAKNCRQTKEIAACRILWLRLSELTSEVGEIMGTTIINYFVMTIIHLLRKTYFFILFLRSQGDHRELHSYLVVIATLLAFALLYCELGQQSSRSVGSNVVNELMRLSFLPQEIEFQREVNLFIQTISYRYPDVELCGFFTLNRELFLSVGYAKIIKFNPFYQDLFPSYLSYFLS